MGTPTWSCPLLLLLLAAMIVAGDSQSTEYFADDGSLVLAPRVASPEPLVNVVWKHETNLLADWVKSANLLEFFSTFKGRAELDVDTGRLTIRNMTKADEGVYTVELNNKPHGESYRATAIARLRQPVTVLVRTLTCSVESQMCVVTCEADTAGAGPVTYGWRFGGGEWEDLAKNTTITKTRHVDAEYISCRVRNPVSEEESKPERNPLYEVKPGPRPAVWAVPVILLLVAGVVAAGLFVAWKLKKWPFRSQGANITESTSGGAPPTGTPGSNKPSEEYPLNEKPPGDGAAA